MRHISRIQMTNTPWNTAKHQRGMMRRMRGSYARSFKGIIHMMKICPGYYSMPKWDDSEGWEVFTPNSLDDWDNDIAYDHNGADHDWTPPIVPPLTLEIILGGGKVSLGRDYHAHDIEDVLRDNGYTALGWLNCGLVKLDMSVRWTEIYSNWSGSYCISANHERKEYFCVDMGD